MILLLLAGLRKDVKALGIVFVERSSGNVVIDDSLLKMFQAKYGTLMGLKLVVFYLNWKRGGEIMAKACVPKRTFYHYRRMLYQDGFLTDEDINSSGHARWVK